MVPIEEAADGKLIEILYPISFQHRDASEPHRAVILEPAPVVPMHARYTALRSLDWARASSPEATSSTARWRVPKETVGDGCRRREAKRLLG